MNHQTAIREEELKNRVATVYFGRFDCTRIVGNIDFCVSPKCRPAYTTLAAQIEPKVYEYGFLKR